MQLLLEKTAMKQEITDEEIIELYSSGISQKDIALNYSVDVMRTQKVLREAGFSTHSYRKTNDYIKKCVIELICSGCTYYGIEERCDISFHSVREIVEKHDLKGISRKARLENKKSHTEYMITEQIEHFLNDYRNGCSYMSLFRKYEFSPQQALIAYNLISEADIKSHKENMKMKMLSLQSKGLSAASIAGQLDISPAIVRKTIA